MCAGFGTYGCAILCGELPRGRGNVSVCLLCLLLELAAGRVLLGPLRKDPANHAGPHKSAKQVDEHNFDHLSTELLRGQRRELQRVINVNNARSGQQEDGEEANGATPQRRVLTESNHKRTTHVIRDECCHCRTCANQEHDGIDNVRRKLAVNIPVFVRRVRLRNVCGGHERPEVNCELPEDREEHVGLDRQRDR